MILAAILSERETGRPAWFDGLGETRSLHGGGSVWFAHDQAASSVRDGRLTVIAEPGQCAVLVADALRGQADAEVGALPSPCTFIVYDEVTRRVVAASDVLSRTPLSYWSRGADTVISSRLLALLRHPNAPTALDDVYLAHLVTDYWWPPPGMTAIAGIRRLRPGESIAVDGATVRVDRRDSLRGTVRSAGSLDDAVEEFWQVLGGSVRRASSDRAALSLSGGIDSAAIGVLLRGHRSPVRAFSLVASEADDHREAEGIALFERAFPEVSARRIECAGAPFAALRTLPLRDEPPLAPVGLLAGRLRMWRAAVEAGTPDIFDGEGGDELFALFVSPVQAIREGDVAAALRYIRGWPWGRRALIWRSVVLPLLPAPARRMALARRARGRFVPSYLREAAVEHPALVEATHQYLASQADRGLLACVEDWISSPMGAGALNTQRAHAAAVGARLVSPMLDRSVVEFVLGLRARWILADGEPKGFLRLALRRRVPEAIRTRHKDTTMAQRLGERVLVSPAARDALRHPAVRQRLDPWVRLDRVEGILDAAARGARPPLAMLRQMESLITFAEWYARAHEEYGVQ